MESQVLYLAIASTLVYVVYMVFGQFGGFGDDGHYHADGGDDSFGVFQYLSLQTIFLVVMSYSWCWLFWDIKNLGLTSTILGTVVMGTAIVAACIYSTRKLFRALAPVEVEPFKPTEGMLGVVDVRVPGDLSDTGIVTFRDPASGSYDIPALSLDEQLSGDTVKVHRVINDRLVHVTKV